MDCFDCKSISELKEAAKLLIEKYPDSRVFAFDGEMGAGKTTFIKSICDFLGVKDVVTSPTFAIINVYKTNGDAEVFHFDLYRLKSIEEFFDIGYEDYFYGDSYCFIEWPEKVEEYLPDGTIRVNIDTETDSELRRIYY
ncbi:MAG: tRNA (adenosine(37)-N6)-threonylcarbamoyltransferase complex ATPase subunit type 1 TsaE [Bacteroidales bacterium]